MSDTEKCPHGVGLDAECVECAVLALVRQVLGLQARLRAEREESARWETSSQEHAQLKEEREEELERVKQERDTAIRERDEARIYYNGACLERDVAKQERDRLAAEVEHYKRQSDENARLAKDALAAEQRLAAEVERLKGARSLAIDEAISVCELNMPYAEMGMSPTVRVLLRRFVGELRKLKVAGSVERYIELPESGDYTQPLPAPPKDEK
jgi:hypothetical protein